MILELLLIVAALALALASRPWRLYRWTGAGPGQPVGRAGASPGPALALLAILPFAWTLPGPMAVVGPLHWSGAGLATLMLGWPVAVPVLLVVALLAGIVDPTHGPAQLIALACWQGVVPASFALGFGVLLKRTLGEQIFIYLFGRAFLGTVLSVFFAALIQWSLSASVGQPLAGPALIGRWLMAWGDGVITGMLASVSVAFAPQWLATWSDVRYLRRPEAAPNDEPPAGR